MNNSYLFLGPKRVAIYTDSDFIMKSIDQWIFKWLQNGWRTANGREVKHKKKFRELLRLMENFQVKWVCTYLIIAYF